MEAENHVPSTEKVEPEMKKRKYYRGSNQIIIEKLSVLLDKCSISDRDAVRKMLDTAEALDHDSQKLNINRSVIRLR